MAFQLVCDYCKQSKKLVDMRHIKDYGDKYVCPECEKMAKTAQARIEKAVNSAVNEISTLKNKWKEMVEKTVNETVIERFGNGADN